MEIETIMMILFTIALIVSMWKIYVFLPDKVLADDDTNKDSVAELENLMILCIDKPDMTKEELFNAIKTHKEFDSKHYWRFNQNRLNNLLHNYLARNNNINTIEDIYKANKSLSKI